MSDAVRRVKFAQEQGEREVYSRARRALDRLEGAVDVVLETARRRRALDAQIEDREIDLIADERAAQPEMSQAAFERHVKVVFTKDETLRDLRNQRASTLAEHERAEAEAELARYTMRVEAARMEELAGLFRFYAGADQSPAANDN